MDSEYRDGLGGHQISRRNVLRGSATLGTGIAAAALIGCSSSKTSSPGGGGTPTGSSAAGTTPAGVKRGGRFTLAVDGDPLQDIRVLENVAHVMQGGNTVR